MKSSKENMHRGAKKHIFKNAYTLRGRTTPTETLLWEKLKGKKIVGLRFRRQHPIAKYILDFYCHKVLLAVEIDGEYHNTPEQEQADQIRTDTLNELSLTVLRFTNKQVEEEMEQVLKVIRKYVTDNINS